VFTITIGVNVTVHIFLMVAPGFDEMLDLFGTK